MIKNTAAIKENLLLILPCICSVLVNKLTKYRYALLMYRVLFKNKNTKKSN